MYVQSSLFLSPPPSFPTNIPEQKVTQEPRPTPRHAQTGLRNPCQRSQPPCFQRLLAHTHLRRQDPAKSRAPSKETQREDPGGHPIEQETGEEDAEAEEKAYETECVVLDDCQFADGAGDGDGKDAGAAAGGEDEIDGLMVKAWDHLRIFMYVYQRRGLLLLEFIATLGLGVSVSVYRISTYFVFS